MNLDREIKMLTWAHRLIVPFMVFYLGRLVYLMRTGQDTLGAKLDITSFTVVILLVWITSVSNNTMRNFREIREMKMDIWRKEYELQKKKEK